MIWSNESSFVWKKEIKNQQEKQVVADIIANKVKDGDVIGVGSGSTSFLAIQSIAKKVKEEGLKIKAIPTSKEIELVCAKLNIPTTSLLQEKPDWAFDGADEVDKHQNLIKGRGGAMYLEKLVMRSSDLNYILVDESKFVEKLGQNFPVPIEVFPTALRLVEKELLGLNPTDIQMRMAVSKDGPVITESGNFILDVRFVNISNSYENWIKQIPGVIESGLFMHNHHQLQILSN